ncbi:jg23874 [Pararge aegeria aegeria]|uniref:Jg23874 protein n=1 Tax=Pararge aegeria aegeria TaxID=348720 RepID=A0A8S4RM70_9NEOP|nr:jg23874 [Pararge aegeria aegeria]
MLLVNLTAKLKWQWARHGGVPRCWNGSTTPQRWSTGPTLRCGQRDEQTTLSASQVAAGSKRHKTVEIGTPYKRPMSSSGRLSVDMMMIMNLTAYSYLTILIS